MKDPNLMRICGRLLSSLVETEQRAGNADDVRARRALIQILILCWTEDEVCP